MSITRSGTYHHRHHQQHSFLPLSPFLLILLSFLSLFLLTLPASFFPLFLSHPVLSCSLIASSFKYQRLGFSQTLERKGTTSQRERERESQFSFSLVVLSLAYYYLLTLFSSSLPSRFLLSFSAFSFLSCLHPALLHCPPTFDGDIQMNSEENGEFDQERKIMMRRNVVIITPFISSHSTFQSYSHPTLATFLSCSLLLIFFPFLSLLT